MKAYQLFEKVLTTAERKRIPKSEFAIPAKAPGSGSYPIPDKRHARNALARVSAHGTPEEKATVRRKVHAKYPDIGEAFEADYTLENHGSIVLLRPLTEPMKNWLRETAPEDAQFFGGAMAIEPRYVEGVIEAAREAGFTGTHEASEQTSFAEALNEGGHKPGCTCGWCKNKGRFGKKQSPEERASKAKPEDVAGGGTETATAWDEWKRSKKTESESIPARIVHQMLEDDIPGGSVAGEAHDTSGVDPEELRMGIEVEMEHTDDPHVAEEIALDHLSENPKYYSVMKKTPLAHNTPGTSAKATFFPPGAGLAP